MKKLFFFFAMICAQLVMAQTCADTAKFELVTKSDGLVEIYTLSEVRFNNQMDFGDGFIGDIGTNYSHLYTANNSYNVCLMVYDTVQSCTSTYCLPVIISDAMLNPCASKFLFNMSDSSSAYFYPYFSSTSYIGSEYHWDFGNGQTFDDHSDHVIDFIPDNSYNICFQTTNSIIGCSHTYCDSLIISSSICPYSVSINSSVQQEYVTVQILPVGYSMQFPGMIDYGDGYSDFNTQHRYTAPGTYIITADIEDGFTYWNCETTLIDTVVISSVASNLCDHTLTYTEVPGTGFYNFNSNVIEAMNGTYSYYWDFGSGYNLDVSSLSGISYTSTGPASVCNIVTSTSGCADTSCVNFTVGYSADLGPCFLTPTQIVCAYKDNSYALFMFTASSIPPLMPINFDVTLGSVNGNAGEQAIFGYGFDPTLPTTYDIDVIIPYGCAASNYNTLTPSVWSNFVCDSVVRDVLVEDVGSGRFKITPIFHPYVMNNLWAFQGNYQCNYNINGYNFADASLNYGSVGFYVQMPYEGNFSGYINTTGYGAFCTSQNIYFSINNDLGLPIANCDAYFNLVEDTGALLPYTYVLNNLSSGNDLAYLWDFGDGNTSTLMLPSHSYATPGFYEINLTINDTINGCTDVYFQDAHAPSKLIQYIVSGSALDIPANMIGEFNLYPNPTEQFISIEGITESAFTVDIFEVSGRHLETIANSTKIDLANYASGLYIVEVKQEENHKSFKIIKQ